MKQHAALFSRIEQTYGVPKEIITAIWGLETGYGSDKGGNRPILRSLQRWPTIAAVPRSSRMS